jgi:phage N-6-adenine-methyltransferase
MNKIVANLEVLPPADNAAIKIGDLYRKGRASMIDSVRSLQEAGRLLLAKKESLPHGQWLSWLSDNEDALGFGIRTADRLMRGAAAKAAKLDVNVEYGEAEAVRLNRLIWGNNVRGTQGTGDNEWYTPEKYIILACKVMGGIDLDPASSEKANAVVKAKRFYSEADNGLTQQWNGKVWLNPPYSQDRLGLFVDKMVEERSAGRVTEAIMLTNNYTDTGWFHKACEIADALCFTRGRIKFAGANGAECAPPQGQIFYYFGDNIRTFSDVFLEVGLILTP